jgi:hypothetical protein
MGLVQLPMGPLQVVSARNNIITYRIDIEDERPWTKSVGVVDLPFDMVKKVALEDPPMTIFTKVSASLYTLYATPHHLYEAPPAERVVRCG